MKTRTFFALLPIGLLLPFVIAPGPAAADPAEGQKPVRQYIGVDKCKLCHIKKTTGAQYLVWKKAKHAKAYETLASPEAKEAAKKQGIDDPQKSEKCLRCHVTAYGAKPEEFAATFKPTEGVGCESCHGPGSEYHKEEVHGKSRELGIAAGMLVPDEKTCLKCHNSESPFYKEFKFEEFKKQIEHPNPERAGKKPG